MILKKINPLVLFCIPLLLPLMLSPTLNLSNSELYSFNHSIRNDNNEEVTDNEIEPHRGSGRRRIGLN